PTIHKYVHELHRNGELTDVEAFGYRGSEKKDDTIRRFLGPDGGKLYRLMEFEEVERLKHEVLSGEYAGYNELLVELFRDWVAEKDARFRR
ncbi:MAG TPA: hypothetical protein VIG24_16100, partial [Acidimicrobiia bacterium]